MYPAPLPGQLLPKINILRYAWNNFYAITKSIYTFCTVINCSQLYMFSLYISETLSGPEFSRLTKRMKYYLKPYRQWSGYPRGVADKYRFFHVGLGKRTLETPPETSTQDLSPPGLPKTNIQELLKNFYEENVSYDDKFYEDNTSSNDDNMFEDSVPLNEDKLYDDNASSNEDKRAPEVFSESLYPLQSGKQKLEAMLDRTLNSGTDGADDELRKRNNPSIDTRRRVESETRLINRNHHSTGTDDNPLDMTLVSPDIDLPLGVNDTDTSVTGSRNINMIAPAKRWWAARALKHFRSPKSSRMRLGPRRQIDPVLYFIGLGRR